MADPVVKFEPYMTAREPGGSLILDRNLIEIKKALADANATFVTIKNTLTQIITSITFSSTSTPVLPPALPIIDSGSDDFDQPMLIPGKPGTPGRDGYQSIRGNDGDDGDDGMPGRPGANGTILTGLGIVHVDSSAFGGVFARQGNGFTGTGAESSFGVTLVNGDSLVVVGPYDLGSIEAIPLVIADGARMAII